MQNVNFEVGPNTFGHHLIKSKSESWNKTSWEPLSDTLTFS